MNTVRFSLGPLRVVIVVARRVNLYFGAKQGVEEGEKLDTLIAENPKTKERVDIDSNYKEPYKSSSCKPPRTYNDYGGYYSSEDEDYPSERSFYE